MHEETLARLPGLKQLYAQAVRTHARRASSTSQRPHELPQLRYDVDDVRVDAEHLTQYQHLLGEAALDTLPAGYVHVLGFPLAMAIMARPDFPLPLLGMVHIANHVNQHRPLMLTDRMHVHAWAENLRTHRSGTQVDLVVEARESAPAGGTAAPATGHRRPAWRGVSTYLAKGVHLPGLAAAPERDRSWDEATPPTSIWNLPATTGRSYAKVSGDVNPIHMSALSAKAFGFPRPIAHGMYTAARALALIGPRRGDGYTWTVDFASPVLLPSTVNVTVSPDSTGWHYRGWGTKDHFRGSVVPHGNGSGQ